MKPGKNTIIIVLLVLLSISLIVFLSKAFSSYTEYQAEIHTTPTPLVRRASVDLVEKPTPDSNSTPEPTPILIKNGSSGEEVKRIQEKLQSLGYLNTSIDGQFGNATKEAVIWFQTQHTLEADGIVGKLSYELLFSEKAEPAKPINTPTPRPSPSPSNTPVPTLGSRSTETDEFLILVNKKVTLEENYEAKNLVLLKDTLRNNFIKIKYKDSTANATAIAALDTMLEAAYAEGLDVWQISSAYRSIATQRKLFNNKKNEFIREGFSDSKASSAALQTVAKPGTSEHHTGLAFDITVPGKFFKDTQQSKWLAQNCWDFGFIIRYQEGKEKITGYIAEPWHIRYVGLPHSKIMFQEDLTLEEYLERIDKSSHLNKGVLL